MLVPCRRLQHLPPLFACCCLIRALWSAGTGWGCDDTWIRSAGCTGTAGVRLNAGAKNRQ